MMPDYDVSEAGLDWVLEPEKARAASAYDWQAYLAFLISWRHALMMAYEQAVRDEVSPRAIELQLRNTRDTASEVQSLLKSMQHE